jgi:D-aminopeptidase
MSRSRARDLGIPFEGTPGSANAITDVAGLTVGHVTLIAGEGKLEVGKGPVRTGVTAIRPRGESLDPVFGAWFTLNGCGEMTGTTWLEESGFLSGPVMITNTYSVGAVKDAVSAWLYTRFGAAYSMPVVAETYDGTLNDINGFHVKQEHAWAALDNASAGPVAEGNVGGGTGMICHGFKGGIGTASRKLDEQSGGYTLGVLVQANHGARKNLRIAGVPVGLEISDLQPEVHPADSGAATSSIIAVLATDCPLLPQQLKRLAKRVALGIARVGGMGEIFSGDIFIAFSTAKFGEEKSLGIRQIDMFPDVRINPFLEATVQATEEAIVNALVAAETMQGINSNTVYAIPHDRLREVLRAYHRLVE